MIKSSVLVVILIAVGLNVAKAQQWKIFGNLKVARSFYQLERISDSKLIVMGGLTSGGATDRCEIIDVETGTITDAHAMNDERALFASVVLKDGRVLVMGDAASIEVYDPRNNQWTVVGRMINPYTHICATMIDDDRVLIIGGWLTRKCEIFNIRTGQSTPTGDFPYVTSLAKAITTADGRVFCFSGRSGGPNSFRSTEVHEYERATGSWSVSGSSAGKYYYPTITATQSGKVIWTGGSNLESNTVNDFINNVAVFEKGGFKDIGHLAEVRAGHGCADVRDGRVIAVGGLDNNAVVKSSCEFVNVATGSVTPAPQLNVGHAYFTTKECVFNGTTYILAVSGANGDAYVPQVEVLEFSCEGSSGTIDLLKESVRLFGSAERSNDKLVLSDTTTFSAGAVWLRSKVKILPSFDVRFSFTLSNGSDRELPDGGPEGADGVVLVLQNRSIGSVGQPGQGIGYEDLPHGVAIEFDSYRNSAFGDPAGSHVAVQVGDGYKLSPNHAAPYLKAITFNNVPPFYADGSKYWARISYESGLMKVYVDTTGDLGEPVITLPIDLATELSLDAGNTVYMGLTSATGFAVEQHEVDMWELQGCGAMVLGVNEDEIGTTHQAPFIIQPNPANDVARLVLREGVTSGIVQIVDVNGALVWSASFANNADIALPVNHLASGMYAVRVVTEVTTWTQMWSVVR